MNKDFSNLSQIFSLAGIWTPNNIGSSTGIPVANSYYSQILLPNGKNGLVMNGWSYDGWDNTIVYPVDAILFEQAVDGTLTVATDNYLPDATTNGSGSVIVYDFNEDGQADIFLPAHNESPIVPTASTAFLSNTNGGFDKVTLNDLIAAHGASMGYINEVPTVFTASYAGEANPYYQYIDGEFVKTLIANPWGNEGSDGYLYSTFSTSAHVVTDFDGDGSEDIAIADLQYGPDYPFASEQFTIGVYDFNDLANDSGSPKAILTPYFNDKEEYAASSSFLGAGITHNHSIWTDDFNYDGKPDILVGGSLWPADYSMLQMFQNTSSAGQANFEDVTDSLNADYPSASVEVDYSMQMQDIDGSGIKSYLIAGSLTPDSDSAQTNYILLNDGTGRMHIYMHEEFGTIGEQVNTYASSLGITTSGSQPRFIEYLTGSNTINLVATLPYTESSDGNFVYKQMFINVPVQLDPTTDFTDSIIISDRNDSTTIRTWAGDDIIHDDSASSISTINGGLGVDTLVYSHSFSTYTVTAENQNFTVSRNALNDTLTNVERLQFSDYIVNLKVEQAATTLDDSVLQQIQELYVAFFNRVPDADGLEYWIGQFNAGQSINQIAESFYQAGIQYSDLTGFSSSMTDTDFINVVYNNVLGREDGPDAEGLAHWTAALESGVESNATLVSSIIAAAHGYKGDTEWGWVADLLDNKVEVANLFAVEYGLNNLTPEESISEGMAIAAAITPTDIDAAIELIGVIV